MTTKTAAQNGQAKKTETPKKGGTNVRKKEGLTAKERLEQLPKLQMLAAKHDKLKESKEKLEAFGLSSDGTTDQVLISNAEGSRFTTSNSAVISDVLKTINAHISKALKDCETELETFKI